WYVPAACSGAFKAGGEARRQELYQHIVNMYRLGDPCTLTVLARQAHPLYPLFFDLDIFGGQSDRFEDQSVHDA
ncbi:PRPF4B, partial [Symbiodinium necroappetens]